MTKKMTNFIIFFTLILLITVFLLYNWILIKLLISKKQLFRYKITTKWRIFVHILFLTIVFSYIFFILKLRFARVGFYYNIFELFYKIKEYISLAYEEYTLSYNTAYLLLYPILISVLLLSIFIFWALFLANGAQILRQSSIAIYVYLLQFPVFKVINQYIFDSIIATRMFIFNKFKNFPNYLKYHLNLIWRNLPIKLEYFLYRGLPFYIIFFDYLTNLGNISTIFYIMPWYYLYGITRSFIIFMKNVILDVDYREISLDMYGR